MSSAPNLDTMSIYALKLAEGYALTIGGMTDAREPFFAGLDGSNAVMIFRLDATSVPDIMKTVRALCAQIVSGDVKAQRSIPAHVAAQLPVVASFSIFNGSVENVDPKADGAWEDLRKVSRPITFLSSTRDLRATRAAACEVFPGILMAPSGEVALKRGDDWVTFDHLNGDDTASRLIPIFTKNKKVEDFDGLYRWLVRIVPMFVAMDAIEMHSEAGYDYVNTDRVKTLGVAQNVMDAGTASVYIQSQNDYDEIDDDDNDQDDPNPDHA